MKHIVDDVRIKEIKELSPPAHLLREFPASEAAATTTYDARAAIHRILHGADDRLLVVVGPCSIHDYDGGDGVCAPAARPSASGSAPTCRS